LVKVILQSAIKLRVILQNVVAPKMDHN
jgi:hypothetical protein